MDQLQDTTIDLTAYLNKFKDSNYTLELRNAQPVVSTIKNLFEKLTLIENFKQRNAKFRLYRVQDREMPEDVAIKWYGSEDFWWAIMLWNEIQSPLTEWPLTEEQLNFLADTYVTIEDKYPRQTYYNLLASRNEDIRQIELLDSNQLQELIFQFRNSVIAEDTKGNRFKIRI
jgi:hypothetical protein